MAKYSIVGGEGGCCGAMAEKGPLIGLICTFIGVILSIYVFVDASSAVSSTNEALVALGSDAEATLSAAYYLLLIGFILGVILMIVYIPVVFIEMEWCGCLGTIKETVLKGAYEQKSKIVKMILTGLSLLAFALLVVFLVWGIIVVGEFKEVLPGVLTIVAVVLFLINLIMSVLYIRS
ncbi:uncharacterized protein LOC134815426 [Bolinopsis microptera]|uniref:uncharacterized protein LOC134815426 n=1 Tax=Bolinopsis microptera TaxID=2820187 RepID=UPI003079EF81